MTFTLKVSGFDNGAAIPEQFAFGAYDPNTKVRLCANRNPLLQWSNIPEGAQSFAILFYDTEVPSSAEHVNQEGTTVPYDLPRTDFYHWVLIDIPSSIRELAEGIASNGVTPKGKPVGNTPYGIRGKNDYTDWFAEDPEMKGVYAGYDGPCPPWNDERIHRYIFKVFALDVATLGLNGEFGGTDVLYAIEGHVLDTAEWSGTYHIYPDARSL